jgi:antitoxin YefM
MKTTTISDFRANMKERLQELENDQDILILSGSKRRDFVILTLDQFNAMEETAHLLSTAGNTERLMDSIAQDKANAITIRQLESGKTSVKVQKESSTRVRASDKRKR